MREILTENGFCYLDNRCLGEFICHPEYFNDRTHLNRIGAEVYTGIFLEQLKGIKSKYIIGKTKCDNLKKRNASSRVK